MQPSSGIAVPLCVSCGHSRNYHFTLDDASADPCSFRIMLRSEVSSDTSESIRCDCQHFVGVRPASIVPLPPELDVPPSATCPQCYHPVHQKACVESRTWFDGSDAIDACGCTYRPAQASAAASQEKPRTGIGSVTRDVIGDLLERESYGMRKYGTSLQYQNGRDPLQDAYQEQLDGAQYLRQALGERAQLVGILHDVAELIDAGFPDDAAALIAQTLKWLEPSK